jgi:3-oxoacyl-[acyl-carrier protein] reductase
MMLEGQTAVVSGGTRGIGAAVALDLLRQGAGVRALYRSDEDAARAFAERATAETGCGDRLRVERLDVTDYEGVKAYWGALEEELPDGVQILVNNAGVRRDGVLAMMSPEDWSLVLATNLTSGFQMSKYAVLQMLRRRYGRIVFVTSPAREHGFEGQANYSASKAGQVGMMRSLAREVAKRGITVNCVSPGFVETDLLADLPAEVAKAHRASVPLKRFGRPEEIAYAVRTLVAPEASYITGSVLDVTGGL